jgi:hypothetical protein
MYLSGNLKEGMDAINESIQKLEVSVDLDRGNEKYRKDLANSYLEAALIAERMGYPAITRSRINSAKKTMESIPISDRSADSWRRLRARVNFEYARLGSEPDREFLMERSINELQTLSFAYRQGTAYKQDLALSYIRRGQISKADYYYEKARKILEPLMKVDQGQATTDLWISANKPASNELQKRKH